MRKRLLLLAICLVAHATFAATITVHVSRGGFDGPILLQLSPHIDDVPPTWIAEQTLPPNVSNGHFDRVAAGTYIVLASGPSPLQRMTAQVGVAAGDDRELTISIKQRRIQGLVTIGKDPLPHVTVRFHHDQWDWSTQVDTDENGAIRGPIWEGGTFDISLRGGSLPSLIRWRVAVEETGDSPHLSVALPANGADGRLVDDAGAPVANALVVLTAIQGKLPSSIRTYTNDDGSFAYSAVEPGPHTLDIVSNRHLVPEKVSFTVPADGLTHLPKITLQSGRTRHVRVLDAAGGKATGAATVAVTTGNRIRAIVRTNDASAVEVPTPADENSVIWVVPASGSFAGVQTAASPEQTVLIRIPPVSASLRIQTLTTAGTVFPNVSLLIAHNGLVIPPVVTTFLARQRLEFATNDDGVATLSNLPVGTYEIWPYGSDAEAEAWIAAMPMSAPVSLNVITGENQVAIKFAAHKTK